MLVLRMYRRDQYDSLAEAFHADGAYAMEFPRPTDPENSLLQLDFRHPQIAPMLKAVKTAFNCVGESGNCVVTLVDSSGLWLDVAVV